MKAELVLKAVKEQLDVLELGLDDIPNAEQKSEFVSEGVGAVGGIATLATTLSKNEYDEALEILGTAIASRVIERKAKFDDGSSVKITFEAVEPAESSDTPG